MTIRLSNYLDFYLLLALENATRASVNVRSRSRVYGPDGSYTQGERHILQERDQLRKDVDAAMYEVSTSLAKALHDYIFLACSGEARHAYSNCTYRIIPQIPNTQHRDEVYAKTNKFDPRDGLKQLAILFSVGWGGSYGGPKWANIAKAGLLYYDESMPKAVFIDHCADLKHNGGMAYNKTSSQSYTHFMLDMKSDAMNAMLDWKLHHNVLRNPPMAKMLGGNQVMQTWFRPAHRTIRLLQRFYRLYAMSEPPQWLAWLSGPVASWEYDGIAYGDAVYTISAKSGKKGHMASPDNEEAAGTYAHYNSYNQDTPKESYRE